MDQLRWSALRVAGSKTHSLRVSSACSMAASVPGQPNVAPSGADANMLLEALSRSEGLPADQVAWLRCELEKAKKPKRKDMQDFSMFGLYLPSALWDRVCNVKEDQMSVLDALVKYLAGSMGLRCPNELTQGTLCGLLVCSMVQEEREKHANPAALRGFFLTVKSRMQTLLAKYRRESLPQQCEYLTVLPSSPGELPLAYQQLGLEFAEPRIPLAQILSVANDIVYRKNGKALQSQVAMCDDPLQFMQSLLALPWVAGLLSTFRPGQAAGEIPLQMLSKPKSALGMLMDRAAPSTSPAAAAPPATLALPAAAPSAALALEDKKPADQQLVQSPVPEPKVEAAIPQPAEPQAPPSNGCKMNLAESMERLRAAAQPKLADNDDQPTLKKPSASVRMKRPGSKAGSAPTASKAMKKSQGKKPDLSKSTKLTMKTMKAKAKATGMKMSALKTRILKQVPKHLKQKFEHGCSTCRWASFCTPSCWAKRGYSV